LPQTDHFVPVFKKNKRECELDIKMQDDYKITENKNILFIFESKKCDKKYKSNNDNASSSSSSSYITDNEKKK